MSHNQIDREPDWVTTRFGVHVASDGTGDAGHSLRDLVVLGLRHNKRRAHLLVSTVLGKHIPTPPSIVRGAADALGAAVIERIGADAARDAIVFGFAETATGLGHSVAKRISASRYLHSTRRRLPSGFLMSVLLILAPSSFKCMAAARRRGRRSARRGWCSRRQVFR